MKQDDTGSFLIEYFKEMRKEINLRITTHTHLVTAKIVTSGAILSFLLSSMADDPRTQALATTSVPLVCLLYDMMIAKNIRNIHKLGMFIRDHIEREHYRVMMWESLIGQKGVRERCYGRGDVVFLSLFTTGVTAVPAYLMFVLFPVGVGIAVTIGFLLLIVFVVSYLARRIEYWEAPSAVEGLAEFGESGHA